MGGKKLGGQKESCPTFFLYFAQVMKTFFNAKFLEKHFEGLKNIYIKYFLLFILFLTFTICPTSIFLGPPPPRTLMIGSVKAMFTRGNFCCNLQCNFCTNNNIRYDTMIFYHIAVMDHSPSPVEDICHLAMEMNVYIQTTSYSLVSNQ